jgi:predicted dehydrogenase
MHKILVIGVGSIGERHLRCFNATGRAETGFCEVNAALRDTIAQRYPAAKGYADLETALRDHWDAAVIASPAHTHITIASRLAEHGLHLLIEKPLSISMEGVDELHKLCNERKRIVGVAYVHRSNIVFAQMREAIVSGRFGKPLQVIAVCGQHFPTFRPAYREIYYTDRSKGGGAIQDALTHIINAAEWIVGPADRVMADAQHLGLPDVSVEDTVHALTRHGDVMGCFSMNQFQQPNETILTVVCERGTVRYEPHLTRWRWMTEPNGPWHDEQLPIAERDAMFIYQANAFMDALESRAELLCTLDEGIQTLRVNLALLNTIASSPWHPVSA